MAAPAGSAAPAVQAVRVLVAGAAGQLGADLVSAGPLMSDDGGVGWSTEGLVRADLDVTDPEAVERVVREHRFDVLVNCTAYNDTAGAESDADAAFRVNARAPELLARAARDAGARFVHVSTDYVFDGRAGRPYTEQDPPSPLGVYGASKLTGETLARRAHPGGTLVIRTAALFGLAAVRRGGNFVETILRVANERVGTGQPVAVIHDVVVSPTATADLADAILALLRADAAPGTYHVVNAGHASWCDFARSIIELEALDVEVEAVPASTYPSVVRRPPFSALDCRKAEAIIGRLPPWRDGLARYLAGRGTP